MYEEHNLKIAEQFEKYYINVAFGTNSKGYPLVLVTEGEDGQRNGQAIRDRLAQVYGPNAIWTLQGVVDIFGSSPECTEWKKTLKWKIKPGFVLPVEQPAAPQEPPTPKKSYEWKGPSWRATKEDEAARKVEHDQARDRLKRLFQVGSPEQAEFQRKLRDISIFTEVTNGRINRTATYRIREQMRQALRVEYPSLADKVITPDSEKPDVKW